MKTPDPNRALLRRLKRTIATEINDGTERTTAHALMTARLINLYCTTDGRTLAVTTAAGAAVNRGAAPFPKE